MHSITKFLGKVVLIAASVAISMSAQAGVPLTPTSTSPGSATAAGPVQGSVSVTINWAVVANATRYGLGVVDNATGGLVVNANVIGATTYAVTLQSGRAYRWNVKACNSSGCSAYTKALYFQTPVQSKTYTNLSVTCAPTAVNEGENSTCKATANFSDRTQTDVTNVAGLKLSSTTYASIAPRNGLVISKAVPSTQTVTVSGSYSYNGGPAKQGSTTLTIKDVPSGVAYPRMSLSTKHAGIHVYTYGKSAEELSIIARNIKSGLGDVSGRTSFEGNGLKAQLAIQTEITLRRFINDGLDTVFADLSKTVDTFWAEGFAVHLLIGVHSFDKVNKNDPKETLLWKGIDLSPTAKWKEWGIFVPFQPCRIRVQAGKICEYDVIFENFHQPLIAKIVASGMADKLSVIYIMNEFDYETSIVQKAEPWGAAACGTQSDWRRCRAEALSYTAKRGFDVAYAASGGKIPIGLKFQKFEQTSGWIPVSGTDQLSHLLIDVMADRGGILGYDCYWANTQADYKCPTDKKRINDILTAGGKLNAYRNGRIEVAEYGAVCDGLPNDKMSGSYRRTDEQDIISLTRDWGDASGFNLFAFNASGSTKGCHAVADPKTNIVFGNAKSELKGLRTQINRWTGQ